MTTGTSTSSSSPIANTTMTTGTGNQEQSLAFHQELQRKEEQVNVLQDRVHSLSAQLEAALASTNPSGSATNGSSKKKKRRHIPLSPHAMNVREEVNGDRTHHNIISAQRERLGRNASIATRQALDQLELQQQGDSHRSSNPFASSSFQNNARGAYRSSTPASLSPQNPPPIQRIIDMFQRPSQHLDYLNSQQFAKDLYKITVRVRHLLETEPRVVFLQSPAYVFGDIHGNLEDLHFFSDNLWRLGLSLTAGNFLFLGDYVDRGKQCLECLAYLFALKLQNPTKLYLLRGNHETRDVNGWEEHYGDRSFMYQCRARFGDDIGYRVWEVCNQAFDRLPLAAVIDQDIFCVHGGIPRPLSSSLSSSSTTAMAVSSSSSRDEEDQDDDDPRRRHATTRIQDILTVPKVAGINPPYEHEDEKYQQVASDCIWSDPASEEQELTTVDPVTGYGESLRGGGAICFGHKAVTQFLEQVDCSYIMRAHEAHAEGVAVSKGARVFTVFSTSQDHNQGSHAMAGCILVDNDKLQVINRSPAYKNQYVHRRDSVSLAHVSEPEIQKRIRLGLVKEDSNNHNNMHHSSSSYAIHNDQEPDDAEQEEQWRDFDDTSSDAEDPIEEDNDDDEDDTVEDAPTASVGHSNSRSSGAETSSGGLLDVGMSGIGNGGDYVFDKSRRSSVDLTTLNLPATAAAVAAASADEMESQSLSHTNNNTKLTTGSGIFGSSWTTAAKSNPFDFGTNMGSSSAMPLFFTAGNIATSSGDGSMHLFSGQQQQHRQSSSSFAPIDENHVLGEGEEESPDDDDNDNRNKNNGGTAGEATNEEDSDDVME